MLLQGYRYEIHYKAGKKNEVADALSRRPYPEATDHEDEPEDVIPSPNIASLCVNNNNLCQTTFYYNDSQPSQTVSTITSINQIETNPSIADHQNKCPDFGPMYKYFKEGELPEDKSQRDKLLSESNFYVFLDNVLYHYYQPRSKRARHPNTYIRQLAVPRCLREDTLRSYHDSVAGGAHLGFERTYRSIQLKYYWPGMFQNVADYVRSCNECQRAKKSTQPNRAPLVNMPVTEPFSRLHMDILGPVTQTSEGYKYILLVVDSFSKWPEAFPLKTQDSKEIAKVLFSGIFCRYGAPHTIVTDRGQNFMSKLVTAVCEIFQVTRHFTSSYHPQTNATCERMNSTIAQCIRTYINKDQDNWPDLLSGVMMALRMSPSTQAADLSPYQILFGREMNLPFDTSLIPKDGMNQDAKEHVNNLMKHLKTVREIATTNITTARQKQKAQYDKTAKQRQFRIGEWVLLHNPKVPKGHSPKFHKPWDGPFYISEHGLNNTYKIIRCSNNKGHRAYIHSNRLKPYNNPAHRKSLDPPPVTDPIDNTHQPPQNAEPNNTQTQPTQDPTLNDASQTTQDPINTDTQSSTVQNSQQDDQLPNSQLLDNDSSPDDNVGYVENLIRYKCIKGKKFFLVKWFGHTDRTWEPEEHLNPHLVQQYHINRTQIGRARKHKKSSCFN